MADGFSAFVDKVRSGDWLVLTQGVHAELLAYWSFLQILLIVAVIFILVSSSEDLLIDLYYWCSRLLRPFGHRRPATKMIVAKPERHIAIMIPAWQESDVIGPMLRNTVDQLDYQNYHIFVGVYPNDDATKAEVDKVSTRHPNVHRVEVGHAGPTTKADCLNHIIAGALRVERAEGIHFDIFVNHDAEDVVHRLELKVVNWFLEGTGMVQLPVLSLNRDPWDFVACHYMDEFAEWHGKDLVVRSSATGMTPSAGVATAISREGIDALRAAHEGELFNIDSLTEDYEIAYELRALGFRSRFVRYWADMPTNRKALFGRRDKQVFRRELVAAREYFPDRVRTAVRQKARWMLGISFYGWRRLGWQGNFVNRFFLWRDRKSMFTAPAAIVGYFLVIQWLLYAGIIWAVPGFQRLPPLVDRPWVWTLILINLFLMLNRIVERAIFVARANGLRYVPLSPLRIVVGNWIGFLAFCRALRQFWNSTLTRRAVKWDKTAHEFPSLEESDVERRLSGLARVPDETIARVQTFTAFDPLLVPDAVRDLLPQAVGARCRAFAVERLSATEAKIALAEPLARRDRVHLEQALAKSGITKPVYRFASASDIAFGVRFAYDRAALSDTMAKIGDLRRAGRIDEYREAHIWRAIRRCYTPLGDVLLRMGAIEPRALSRETRRFGADGAALAERLEKRKLVSAKQLSAAAARQNNPPFDIAAIAARFAQPGMAAWPRDFDQQARAMRAAVLLCAKTAAEPAPSPKAYARVSNAD